MQRPGRGDLWFIGLERSPDTGRPLAGRVLWPRGHAEYYKRFADKMGTGPMTGIYKDELGRTRDVWLTGSSERFYPFAKTAKPTFHRYDNASDSMFYNRLVRPLIDANENAWQLIWTDKEHKPKFIGQPERVKMLIWKNLGRMLFLSHEVGLRRLDYLEGRYAGVEPPEYVPKVDPSRANMPTEPDIDYDPDQIQLDDKEF